MSAISVPPMKLSGLEPVSIGEGTRDSARAAAENEPRSSTARNTCTLSEEKAMACQSVNKSEIS